MSLERPVLTTIVVSPEDAFGYMQAGWNVPGTRVEIITPRDPAQRAAAVAEHLGTLIREHQPGPDELGEFEAAAAPDIWAAFEAPDPAVLVRIQTASGGEGVTQAEQISQLAIQYRGV
jgi:hypothetical protein